MSNVKIKIHQVIVTWGHVLTQRDHDAYRSMRLGKINSLALTPLLNLYVSKVIGKNAFDFIWPRMIRRRGRSWGQTYKWVIESGVIWDNLEIISIISSYFRKKCIWAFSHCRIMVWSEHWPDLRSLKSKFRDIRLQLLKPLSTPEFHVDPLRTVVTTQSQIFLEVGSLDLIWWPDLQCPWATIFRKGEERMHEKVLKNSAIHETPDGGRLDAPPPPRRDFGRNRSKTRGGNHQMWLAS